MNSKPIEHNGFVILFTILISAIILMIGLGIYSVATRETTLSGTAREAQYAFYAADAGLECALFAQGVPQGPLTGSGGALNCGVLTQPDNQVTGTGQASNPYIFDILIDPQIRTCAHVTVFDTTTISGPARRVISQGYNLCDAKGKPLDGNGGRSRNPLLVERDLDTTFQLGTAPAGTDDPAPEDTGEEPE